MESATVFPFRKLSSDKYLILEVLMYDEHQDIYKFLFTVNKETRKFIQENFITAKNGFRNEGLIDLQFFHGTLSSEEQQYNNYE